MTASTTISARLLLAAAPLLLLAAAVAGLLAGGAAAAAEGFCGALAVVVEEASFRGRPTGLLPSALPSFSALRALARGSATAVAAAEEEEEVPPHETIVQPLQSAPGI